MSRTRIIVVFAAVFTLCACSGGYGESTQIQPVAPPGPPAISVSADIKQLIFRWDAAPGATHYKLMEDPDGNSGFTQVGGDISGGTLAVATHIAVHLHDWANARYLVQACNSVACTGSAAIGTMELMLDTIGYFKGSETTSVQLLGQGVALSADGKILAAAGGRGASIGTVYIFRFDGAKWFQEALIQPLQTFDVYVTDVALSADGNTLAIGMPDYQGKPGNAFVYRFDGTSWVEEVRLRGTDIPLRNDPLNGDFFGEAVALSADGDTLAVGAENTSRVYLFRFDGLVWNQQFLIEAHQEVLLGEDVALSADGNTLVTNAPFEDRDHQGVVYVFRFDGMDWNQEAVIESSNSESGDEFWQIALSGDGNTLVVGAGSEDSGATGIDGDQGDNSAPGSGALYVFRFNGVDWDQVAYIKSSNTEAADQFAGNVALSADGSTIAAAATEEDSNAVGINGDQSDNSSQDSGAVYLFRFDGTSWSQSAYVKPPNADRFDEFGMSNGLALSADGSTLVVGAPGEDSAATGINGDQNDNSADKAGAVYVY